MDHDDDDDMRTTTMTTTMTTATTNKTMMTTMMKEWGRGNSSRGGKALVGCCVYQWRFDATTYSSHFGVKIILVVFALGTKHGQIFSHIELNFSQLITILH
jgi:hypothetical protein